MHNRFELEVEGNWLTSFSLILALTKEEKLKLLMQKVELILVSSLFIQQA